jgi:hypothetical protein
MFVGHEVLLDVSFAVARARFAQSIRDRWLHDASGRAYADGFSGLVRVGPFGAVVGTSKLVAVQMVEPVPRDDAVVLPLRWEATGVMGRLFPVLDADVILRPADAGKTVLALTGAYRPPLAGAGSGLDRLVLHRVAMATVRSLLGQVAQMIEEPAVQGAPIEPGEDLGRAAGQAPNADIEFGAIFWAPGTP